MENALYEYLFVKILETIKKKNYSSYYYIDFLWEG